MENLLAVIKTELAEHPDSWTDKVKRIVIGLLLDMIISDGDVHSSEISMVRQIAEVMKVDLDPDNEIMIRHEWANQHGELELPDPSYRINQTKLIYQMCIELVNADGKIHSAELKTLARFSSQIIRQAPDEFRKILGEIPGIDANEDFDVIVKGVYDELKTAASADSEARGYISRVPVDRFIMGFLIAFRLENYDEKFFELKTDECFKNNPKKVKESYKHIWGNNTEDFLNAPFKILRESNDKSKIEEIVSGGIFKFLMEKCGVKDYRDCIDQWGEIRGKIFKNNADELSRLCRDKFFESKCVKISNDISTEMYTPAFENFISDRSCIEEREKDKAFAECMHDYKLETALLKGGLQVRCATGEGDKNYIVCDLNDFRARIFPVLHSGDDRIGMLSFNVEYNFAENNHLDLARFLYVAFTISNEIREYLIRRRTEEPKHKPSKIRIKSKNKKQYYQCENLSFYDIIEHAFSIIPGDIKTGKKASNLNEPIMSIFCSLNSKLAGILDTTEIKTAFSILRTVDSSRKSEIEMSFMEKNIEKYTIKQVRSYILGVSNRSVVVMGVSSDNYVKNELPKRIVSGKNKKEPNDFIWQLLTMVSFQRFVLLSIKHSLQKLSKKLNTRHGFWRAHKNMISILKEVQQLRELMISFGAQANFKEVSYNYWRQIIYEKLHSSFRIKEIRGGLGESLRELFDYSERANDQKIQAIIQIGTVILLPLVFIEPVFTLMGEIIKRFGSTGIKIGMGLSYLFTGVIISVLLLLAWIIYRVFMDYHAKRNSKKIKKTKK